MADLSKVLGDVYEAADRPEANRFVSAARQQAPEWSDESRLDAAFADWTPGPPSDAPAAERALFASAPTQTHAEQGPLVLDDDLAAALSEALAEAPPLGDNDLFDQDTDSLGDTPAIALEPSVDEVDEVDDVDEIPVLSKAESHALLSDAVPEPVAELPEPFEPSASNRLIWNRSDDDVLPRGMRRRGLSLSFFRR
jgi:hypothetical protein